MQYAQRTAYFFLICHVLDKQHDLRPLNSKNITGRSKPTDKDTHKFILTEREY